MYDSIYNNKEWLKRYLEAISYTIESKKKILNAVIDEITLPINKTVCFLPSDVGVYYQLLKELEPNNKFILIDKSEVPLEYISKSTNHSHTEYIISDISETFNYQLNCDIALTFLAMQHIKNIKLFFKNVNNCLYKDGTFVIVTFSDSDVKHNIMTDYFGNKGHNFYPTGVITDSLYNSNFQNTQIKDISFTVRFKEIDIPLIFNKFSNSFLFKQSQSKIVGFQQYLREKATNGYLTTNHRYSIFISKKA